MKNVHLIPTDKPSRLYGKNGNYKLDSSTIAMDWYISSAGYKPQNIYITSNEEIKIGDKGWLFEDSYVKSVCEFDCTKGLEGIRLTDKKIILTTDQDLIKNGVQSLDNEFLQWFVKNPNCEWVEIEGFEPIYGHQNNFTDILYKIIIPQEEPKQIKCYCGHTTYCDCSPLEDKQETLEEAAENFANSKEWMNGGASTWVQFSFKKGAKWQAKKMYSEEEVKKIAEEVRWQAIGNPLEFTKNFNKWFEQFKKK